MVLNFSHPVFDVLAFRVDCSIKTNSLFLCTEHGQNGLLALSIELNLINVLEDFVQIRLDSERFFGLRKNLEQLIVGQEIKSGEFCSFGLQIIIERLLDHVQSIVIVPYLIQNIFYLTNCLHVYNLSRFINDHSPKVIGGFEVLALFVKLFRYVG